MQVYGAPGSKGGVAVHLEQRGLASGPALGHAEKPFGVPFRIAAPPGSDHPGMVAMLLPSQHTPRGCMVILLSLATGDAWLHTGDVRFTEQVCGQGRLPLACVAHLLACRAALSAAGCAARGCACRGACRARCPVG